MKIEIFNTDFPTLRRYSRIIDNANPSFIPRKGDRIDVGYNPCPVVKNVIWYYDENKVLVEIGS